MGYVYANGHLIAKQNYAPFTVNKRYVTWENADPVTGDSFLYFPDPLGVNVGPEDPYISQPESYGNPGDVILNYDDKSSGSCDFFDSDGSGMNCEQAELLVRSGAAGVCPDNDCGIRFEEGHWVRPEWTDEGFVNVRIGDNRGSGWRGIVYPTFKTKNRLE